MNVKRAASLVFSLALATHLGLASSVQAEELTAEFMTDTPSASPLHLTDPDALARPYPLKPKLR